MCYKGKYGAIRVCLGGFGLGPSLNLRLSPTSNHISPSLLRVTHLLHTSFDVLADPGALSIICWAKL